MNSMEGIAELLQSLLADGMGGGENSTDKSENDDTDNNAENLFGGIDLDMIMMLGSLFAEMQKPDKNTALLTALRPMMRDENQKKIDTAMNIMRILAIIPILKENGLLDKFF